MRDITEYIDDDLDSFVDYKAEYSAAITKKQKIVGDELSGCCPFHDDNNPSFSANLKTGQWICRSNCGHGNIISFIAKLDHIDPKEAAIQLRKKYGRYREPKQKSEDGDGKKKKGESLAPYSVARYSVEKHIPEDFLRDTCKCRDGGGGQRQTMRLEIPYFYDDGTEVSVRYRYGGKNFRWAKGSSGKLCLYGEWRIREFRKNGNYVCLVEGESDSQSLWYMGINAMGAPGKDNFPPERAAYIDGMRLYIHQEPDQGGAQFRQKIIRTLHASGFTGSLYVWKCSQLGGLKDPSAVLMKYGQEKGKNLILGLLNGATLIDIDLEISRETLTDAPIALETPPGWAIRSTGIFRINENAKSGDGEDIVCRTPILITRRLRSIDADGEKVEIAFFRDGKWHYEPMLRSDAFNTRNVIKLTDLGCTISSTNASGVVSYLTDLEQMNLDAIPVTDSVSRFGWHEGNRFVPGRMDGLTLDLDATQRATAAALTTSGTLVEWVELMKPHRKRSRFRAILASSFAAPLLKIVKSRNFMVYNWGGSRGGKTAALKAALSVWGEPDRLMISFNSTQVALERMSALFCDMPLGIDERQLAGRNQDGLEKIVYMLGSGIGKARGAKSGGLQRTEQWRAIAIATGEEPIAKSTSQTGVSTRVLEIYGVPFDREEDAADMHKRASEVYGTAGPAYIGKLLELGDQAIRDDWDYMYDTVSGMKTDASNGAQLSFLATVALADKYIGTMFFGESDASAEYSTLGMVQDLLKIQSETARPDVNVSAVNFIRDWVMKNSNAFRSDEPLPLQRFGEWDRTKEDVLYVVPDVLREALDARGFESEKTIQYLLDEGMIIRDKYGKKTVTKKFGGKSNRMFKIHLESWGEDTEDDDSGPTPEPRPVPPGSFSWDRG